MDSTSLCSSVLLPLQQFSTSQKFKSPCPKKRDSSSRICATRRDPYDHQDYDGKLVDESMIVLRKRVHEMKMVERNYEPPSNWMDWEKQYTSYDSDVCEAMGLLQTQLMNTRPSLALGMVVLVALSVPTSAVVIMFHLMEIAKGILSGIHLS